MPDEKTYTYEELSKLKRKELDALMHVGRCPTVDDVLGFEFKGWNLNAFSRVLGNRKFKKGFFGQSERTYCWGYNMPVVNNDIQEEWNVRPNAENPKRYYFYKERKKSNIE